MEGIINIEGLIGFVDGEQGVELTDVISQVRNQQEATSFKVIINSRGGCVKTGEDIYAYLKALKVPVTTVGVGTVASVATVIFLAGSKRHVIGEPLFMIHYPMGNPSWLNSDEIAEYGKQVKKVEDRMVAFYVSHTGLEEEAIRPMLRNETFLNKKQLEEFGFITSGEAEYKIAAVAKININQNQNKMSKENDTLLKAIFDAVVGKKQNGKKQADTVALKLLTAEQVEVDFYELSGDAEVVVGSKATIDGTDANGEIVMADGRTFVFVDGVLDTIVSNDDNPELEEALEQLEMQKTLVKDLTGEVDTYKEELAQVKAELKAKNEIINRIEQIRSKYEEEQGKQRKEGGKQARKKEISRFKKAMSNIKNQK